METTLAVLGQRRRSPYQILHMETEVNPYESTEESTPSSGEASSQKLGSPSVLAGIVWAIVATIPIAALLGLVFRFPVPFNGYMSGPSAFFMSMFGAAFYGLVFGGWIVVGTAGGLFTWVARALCKNEQTALVVSRVLSVLVALVGCAVMSTLDWIIGPF